MLKNKFSIVLVLFFQLCSWSVCAQTDDSTQLSVKRIKVLPVPTFGYEPETKTHVGAVCLFTINLHNDSLTRQSNAKLELNYTFRNQMIIESEWNYFSKKEKWYSDGVLHVSYYPDFYYGIGPNSNSSGELLFSTNRLKGDVGLYRNVVKKLFLGGGIRYYRYSNVASDERIDFGELSDAENLGVKASLFKDTRNNLLNATDGVYALMDVEHNFSALNYWKLGIDLRKYFSNNKGFSLSTRLFNSFILNTPTFYDYNILGGDDFVRGYFYGRYRDKHLSTLQTEIRTPHIFRFGMAVIGGISSLYNAPSMLFDTIRPNYGLGLRYLVDKNDKINLRLDYVIGSPGNSGFYISFGESF